MTVEIKKLYYENGKIKAEIPYENGKKNGVERWYSEYGGNSM